jgi:YspA, cpYpsA-related SLOG family
MRVLICGDRNWQDRDLIELKVIELENEPRHLRDGLTLIHGAARGADSLAASVCDLRGWEVKGYPADWARLGRAAGIIRNQQMLDEGEPDLVVAFHDDLEHSKGTGDMVRRARKAGIPVEVVTHDRKA